VKLACMPSCVRPKVHSINVLCVMIVKKCIMAIAQVVFSYFVLDRSKIHLVLTTKDAHLRSLLFRLQDGVNSVVR